MNNNNILDFNIDFLLEETFALNKISTVVLRPAAPGVIYRIDEGNNTFCIRAIATSNIEEEFHHLNFKMFKLEDAASISLINFYETPTVEQAQAVIDQISNRRFPKQEDLLCNISDPGFSWWMDVEYDRFEVFFRSHGINRMEKYIQLGPIGDQKMAALRMGQVQTLLRSSFPVSEFSSTEKGFAIGTLKPEHLGFKSFRDVFVKGENFTNFENFPDNTLGRTLYFYFHELASIRRFWIEVQSKLS